MKGVQFWALVRKDTLEGDPLAPINVPTTYSTANESLVYRVVASSVLVFAFCT